MRAYRPLLLFLLGIPSGLFGQTTVTKDPVVIFQQAGFPTIASEPVAKETLVTAINGSAIFADIDRLRSGEVLAHAPLLVLPYGSALPAEAWLSIARYLHRGGNLLVLGGQPLRVPVLREADDQFKAQPAQDSYSREIDLLHTYPVPLGPSPVHFAWRDGYDFLPKLSVATREVFAEEGRLSGLGYLDAPDGTHLAAPVIVMDHFAGSDMPGTRIVALPFTPMPGYWNSADGVRLIRACAQYAAAGATSLTIETQYAALRQGELPEITAHLRGSPRPAGTASRTPTGQLRIDLLTGDKIIDHAILPSLDEGTISVPFRKPLPSGVYTVRGTWTPGSSTEPQEFAENGFVVEDLSALQFGPALGTRGDFLTLGGRPFLPVGTNYFTTEENGWDFSGPRNAAVWEHDFADMEQHGVTLVRTGVWGGQDKFVEPLTGGANERFLRNVEAYLAAAQRHHIAVNFTFFAFSPHVFDPRRPSSDTGPEPTPPNPYLDQGAVEAEHKYVLSVVNRFGRVPWLCYDLINEPSFSNPRVIFHGNVPNGDPVELAAWHAWLRKRYGMLQALENAWRTTPEELHSFDTIPLPKPQDLAYNRYGNAAEVRAPDYNLFAQDMFSGWVHSMVEAIRSASSMQLIDVGQDEGGVSDRLLNQFYANAGVSFTTNHTYWKDDALLWDSVAAKRPGMPNITGETGYQPAWNPDGTWRYDELTGSALEERKWALGFAAGSSGALQWDWAREVDFGIERSDGSAKIWKGMMRDLGRFAKSAAPFATDLQLPEVAIVLPESLQLSVFNAQALEAQQTAVRTLYGLNRVEAYAVGEYDTDMLGKPKLILLPSAYSLNEKAWADIVARVRDGATLLISGPFSADGHLHADDRAASIGLPYALVALAQRFVRLHLPSGDLPLEYAGTYTTVLDRAVLENGASWAEVLLGAGKVLFSAFPLELNSQTATIAAVYGYALDRAGVDRTYTTDLKNPGILICPTRLPNATLYVLSSETEQTTVRFRDTRSGKTFAGQLDAGRAALLLVSVTGKVLARYNWDS